MKNHEDGLFGGELGGGALFEYAYTSLKSTILASPGRKIVKYFPIAVYSHSMKNGLRGYGSNVILLFVHDVAVEVFVSPKDCPIQIWNGFIRS